MKSRVPLIAIVLLAGLAVRLLIVYVLAPGEGFKDDVLTFEAWANTLADHGPSAFYANALPAGQSPGYLYGPGYLYSLWLVGVVGHAVAGLIGQAPADVVAFIIKLPSIAADLVIAALLYRTVRGWHGPNAGVATATLYLFMPLSWYDSAVWGQVEAFGALLLLVSLLLLLDGWSEPSVVFAVLAVETKPQYAIGLGIVAAVLIGRHLLRPGSGPVPGPRGQPGALSRRLVSWAKREQGPVRLVSSAVAGAVVFLAVLLPFDMATLAPARFADIPVIGPVAGLLILDRSAAGYFPYLTVNAFNFWALFGPDPLTHGLANGDPMTLDSLRLFGPLSAEVVGVALFGIVALVVLGTLLIRDSRNAILIGFTVLALAFFTLPTRAHERYLFPALVTAVLLSAASLRWRWWAILLATAQAANLHAVVTLAQYGTPGLQQAPLGTELRTDRVVAALSIGHCILFLFALWEFSRQVGRPALTDLREAFGAWRRRSMPGGQH